MNRAHLKSAGLFFVLFVPDVLFVAKNRAMLGSIARLVKGLA